jgi:hypothetical protein
MLGMAICHLFGAITNFGEKNTEPNVWTRGLYSVRIKLLRYPCLTGEAVAITWAIPIFTQLTNKMLVCGWPGWPE